MTVGLVTTLVLVLSICVYITLVGELFFYLEKHHQQMWRELGEPWPWNSTPGNIFSSAKFIFFGGALRLWDDPRLRVRVVGVWVSFAVTVAVIVLANAMGR